MLATSDPQNMIIPEPEDRLSIDDIILEIQEQQWYRDQIVDWRTFQAKEPIEGSKFLHLYYFLCLKYFHEDCWMSLFQIPYNRRCENPET
jgi:hypothetical protein